MSDPYKILNVSRSATDDEIKKAYRNLAKKYHPDKYQNSPLADQAAEKMKEINAAYDQILSERKSNIPYNPDGSSHYYQEDRYYSEQGGNEFFSRIRMLINQQRYDEAERLLAGVQPTERTAEWYYLMGVLCYIMGRLDEGENYLNTACRMDPGNSEYAKMKMNVDQIKGGSRGGYRRSSSSSDNCDMCSICSCMLCVSQCCCDCSKICGN